VAQRVSPVAIPAPVAELVEAWNDRSADRFAAALAHDAQISVPPLHLELRGRDEAWDGVARLFGAFGALRYTSRHRYLTPDTVTDEALLEGLQTRDFLGAPPPGRPGAVAARVMIRHDGRQVTALTIWPDVAALRQLSAGMARRIDLRSTDPAAPVVAALRATIPATEGKLSVGQERQSTQVATPEGATLLPGAPPAEDAPELRSTTAKDKGKGKSKDGKRKDGKRKDGKGKDGKDGKDKAAPKPPLSRKARRLRGIAAGVLMLGVAGALGAYVVQGVKGAKTTVASAAPSAKHKASPTGKASRGAASSTGPSGGKSGSASGAGSGSSSTASSKPTFDPKTRTYTFKNTVLFELNSSALRPEAQNALRDVAAALIGQKRYGDVVVTGFTDSTGTTTINMRLSLRRASSVKDFLSPLLPPEHFTVLAYGKGASHYVASNSTEAGREKNRRVQIHVPDPSS
jgi:outer membrane protein OmpA-like peptidoglycan-associated protein